MFRRLSLFVPMLLVGAGALGIFGSAQGTITDDINPLDARLITVDGGQVIVGVTNTSAVRQSGTVTAQVVKARGSEKASAQVNVPAGATVTVGLILGTITDDIDPLDLILGTITDDINPQ